MKTTINLKCARCNKSFEKSLATYNFDKSKRRRKWGANNWFCSRDCVSDWSATISPFKHIYKNIKGRAKKKDIKVNIDSAFLSELWERQEGLCSYTKLPMSLPLSHSESRYTNKKSGPFTGSIDRRDSSGGYTKRNVHFICLALNYAKKDWAEKEFQKFLKAITSGEVVELVYTTDLKSVGR